jgi:hypothetical protein
MVKKKKRIKEQNESGSDPSLCGTYGLMGGKGERDIY